MTHNWLNSHADPLLASCADSRADASVLSCPTSLSNVSDGAGSDAVPPRPDGVRSSASQAAGESAQILFTPAQAAALLQVRESWLRRRAARRLVPCTFLGKHLRFSRENLVQIASEGHRGVRSRTVKPRNSAGRRRYQEYI
ncbi:helix-turn-helix domain-containing protein [Lentzea sp. JNUCC 0626]|uniref:helix-turn-helix domain-containing protein n=1 Tax=Lentzea sp. JNUCC 0626 TaxID=3367513 RepID=UPI003749CF9C